MSEWQELELALRLVRKERDELQGVVAALERERERCAHDYGQECELRDEAEARAKRAETALREARGYVEEPGPPGTVIETTEESAARSAALLEKIDDILARREARDG